MAEMDVVHEELENEELASIEEVDDGDLDIEEDEDEMSIDRETGEIKHSPVTPVELINTHDVTSLKQVKKLECSVKNFAICSLLTI